MDKEDLVLNRRAISSRLSGPLYFRFSAWCMMHHLSTRLFNKGLFDGLINRLGCKSHHRVTAILPPMAPLLHWVECLQTLFDTVALLSVVGGCSIQTQITRSVISVEYYVNFMTDLREIKPRSKNLNYELVRKTLLSNLPWTIELFEVMPLLCWMFPNAVSYIGLQLPCFHLDDKT